MRAAARGRAASPLLRAFLYFLLRRFGKDAPAIGFMIVVDDLLAAMNRQGAVISGIERCTKLYYTPEDFREKLLEARQMRAAGKCVELLPKREREKNS